MNVRCPVCKIVYDDAERLTICPHDPLGGGKYCREHDLYFCPFHDQGAQASP